MGVGADGPQRLKIASSFFSETFLQFIRHMIVPFYLCIKLLLVPSSLASWFRAQEAEMGTGQLGAAAGQHPGDAEEKGCTRGPDGSRGLL